ncbi:hypothetical protein [Myceligenerans indicum]|uniref:Uncharacterized protein n=1 Tax=Myceligenerans indicum TaxID=2593663 RepID=A0ABS1LMU8_9MICO|nr:hypothetical protein [Myceligenerans indicum]MBL0887576.1 hypothetical protein [Myceligenerans indicum]
MTETRDLTAPGLPPLSRRGFITAVGAVSAAAVGAFGLARPAAATSSGTVLPLVDALPAGAPDRTLFAPDEQVYAAYLMILAPLANSVVDDDPDRYGWMEDGWQRKPNEPFNARIMEHVATLSWFAAHDRPWNPYYRDANLLGRLDAAIGFYLGLQHADGSWPEYRIDEHGLAPTGFGTVALSATLRDLKSIGALPTRRTEIEQALRLSSTWLTDLSQPYWGPPIRYTNQVAAGLAGVAQTAHVLGDASIGASLTSRMTYLLEHGLAPAGFFSEANTYDAGYNFEVMLPDLGHIYELTGDASALELARRFADWLGYAVVLEPGKDSGFHFSEASARNPALTFIPRVLDAKDRAALGRVFLEDVPRLRAFYPPAGDKQAARADWAASTDPVEPRAKQNSSPRLYMHVSQAPDGVTAAERDAQVAEQPYLRSQRFTELRTGIIDQQFVFVRRPGYYLGAMYGDVVWIRQRTGPGMFWHPQAGMVLLSTNKWGDDSWAMVTTSGADASRVNVTAVHHEGNDASGPVIQDADLTGYNGTFTTRYTTASGATVQDITHRHDGIVRTVQTTVSAVERLPLVVGAGDVLEFSDGTRPDATGTASTTASGFSLTRGGTRIQFWWGTDRPVSIAPTGRTFFDDASRSQHLLTVEHSGSITVEVTAIDVAQTAGTVTFAATADDAGPATGAAVHLVNLDAEPVDFRIIGQGAPVTAAGVAPGASVYVPSMAPTDDGFQVTAATAGHGRHRTATRRLAV